MLDIRLVLSAIRYSKAAVFLVIVQIALTFAIVSNVTSISAQLWQKMSRPTGMAVFSNIAIESVAIESNFNAKNAIAEDLAMIRSTPGVESASVLSEIPLGASAMVPVFRSESEKYGTIDARGYVYLADQYAVDTLGINVIAGRNFNAEEIQEFERVSFRGAHGVNPVLVTEQWGKMLFPDGDALGQSFRTSMGMVKIIGIIEVMQGAWADWEGFDRVALFPGILLGNRVEYLVRTEANRRDALIGELDQKLYGLNDRRVITSIKGQDEFLDSQYQNHSALLTSLMVVGLILMTFAVLGIYALTKFNISRQTRGIGIKRALGATKGMIVSYYLFENMVIATVGLLVGLSLVTSLNQYLVTNYDIATIDWVYVPLVAAFYVVTGLIAVYFPAVKAANAPAVEAIRAS